MEGAIDKIELLTMKEVCSLLKVSRKTGYRLCRKWGLQFIRFGGCLRIYRVELEDALKKNTHFF